MTGSRTPEDDRQLRIFWILLALGGFTALAAATAGILLLIVDPEAGSGTESTLGLTAAVCGLSTAALVGAAAIYAQVKNLWRFAPTWFRYIAWAALIVAAIIAVITSIVNNGAN